MKIEINPDTDVLLIIDPQNDFCPGGSLAVAGGDEIMPGINELARQFKHIVVTGDWHPAEHRAFAVNHGAEPFTMGELSYGMQVLWPAHCVPGTFGAEFHVGVAEAVQRAQLILRKGLNPEIHSYSAFYEDDRITSTGLGGYLNQIGMKRVIVVGLAYDFCVGFSAVDAIRDGLEAIVVKDLTRGIGMPVKDEEGAVDTNDVIEREFAKVGVTVINLNDL